ncbi:MAG: PQQ-binding-like beta-propeller repeat protein [Gemmataceae bacterium]
MQSLRLALRTLASLLFLFVVTHSSSGQTDWPHWRGPNRNDITAESSGWKKGAQWPAKKDSWRVTLGDGSSSPLVVGKKVYAMGWRQNKDTVYCLDLTTGKTLWKQSYACPPYGRRSVGDQGLYKGPSSTPEYDTETGWLYTLSTDGHLNCWNTRNQGKKVWGLNLHEGYTIDRRPQVPGSGRRDYGYTTAPLIHGDWVIVEVGAREGTVMAFQKKTGKEVWRSKLKDPAGHTGGLAPMTVEDIPCVAVFTHFHLAVIRLDKNHVGETLAKYPWVTYFANSIPTPAVHNNYVLITSSYNQGTICKLKITKNGATKVWERRAASGVCSPIIYKGHIYWAWQRLYCLDFETGKEKWVKRWGGSPGSCIVTSDEKLIAWGGRRGQLLLLDIANPSAKRVKTLAFQPALFARHPWPHVVLANGHLLCKDRDGNMRCFAMN